MPRAYVTGATGFIGAHVSRELALRGWDVRAERIDLGDRDGLTRAMQGCDAVFHVAALYSYTAPQRELERVNVQGTANVIAAVRAAGVSRLVHCSTCGTCGPVPGRPACEADGPAAYELAVPYKRTKIASEQLVLAAVREGLDAVVVNPTAPVGDGDLRPTPTGQMVAGVANGRIRAFVGTTGLNVVDVRDVATGHVLAWERGERGERYLLGGENMTLEELFGRVAAIAGRPRPRLRVPYPVVQAAAMLGLANRHEVRLARLPMYFSSEKAHNTLGYRAAPVELALERAVAEALARPVRNRPVAALGRPTREGGA